jgi:hypothetical protein
MAEAQCFSVVQHPHYILLRHGGMGGLNYEQLIDEE